MARVVPSSRSSPTPFQSIGNKEFDDKAEVAGNTLAMTASQNLDGEGDEGRWIRETIYCRECCHFVHAEVDRNELGVQDRKCQCGYPQSEHQKENGTLPSFGRWEYSTHSIPVKTNAFGEIEFVGHGDNVAKYVRVDTDTKMEVMKKLMTEKWKMERPNLLISVTGGAKNFLMRARLKDAFRRGLMKAALSTGAWIVTGGTNTGVMKHVGEAVRDYGLTAEGRVIAIGIAPWGCVQNKEELICDPKNVTGKWPAIYCLQGEQKSKQSFLDPNHTHFILVDNGTQCQFATEIEFRAKLEKEISQWKTNTGNTAVGVPVALLVLEGGSGTLKTVMNAIKNNTPAIVIKGSGKCADILAYAAQNVTEKEVVAKDKDGKPCKETVCEMDEKLKSDIQAMVEETFGAKEAAQHTEWVEICVQKPHLISVFELESSGGSASSGVDMAILKALLKANKDQVMDQLTLALAWNRIDIAKSEIFTDERPWPTGALDEKMMLAIQLNRVDFVDLFLDNGISLKDFLTVRRLLKLYNEIPKNCLLYTLLLKVKARKSSKNQDSKLLQDRMYFDLYMKQCQKFSLADVGILVQDLLGDYFQPRYLEDHVLRKLCADEILSPSAKKDIESNSCVGTKGRTESNSGDRRLSRPAQDLFLWAVLMNQQDLAELFWREGNEPTAAALVANGLLKAMRRYTNDNDMLQKLQTNADKFEELAIGVINNCYMLSEQKAHDLLTREMTNWGKATCVLVAVQADNKGFISQTACQSLLNSIWMGRMSQENSLIKLLPCVFIFPLILGIITFRDKEQPPSTKAYDSQPSFKREHTQAGELNKQVTQASLKAPEDGGGKAQHLSNCEKIHIFYTAPVVIFILNCFSYLIFLGLYSYILLVQLSPEFHFLEGILIGWVITILMEEGRQLISNYAHSLLSKVVTYLKDLWNFLDMVTIFLFLVGMVLRFVPNDTCFEIARVILSINLISFFFRILHIFSVNKELGPKLVMIRRMIRDLMWFVVILMVFIGAYAIASEAILYPQTELSWKLLYHLPRKAYWQIYGELFLDEIEGKEVCTNDSNLYNGYIEQRCPSSIGKYLVPVLMGIYVLMTNVLLLNLLIAMFSYTFEMMQQNTDNIWRYMQLLVVMDYSRRPVLPPPFVLLSHLISLVQYLFNQDCLPHKHSRPSDAFRKHFSIQDEKRLIQWENIIADTYLTKIQASEADSVEGRVKVMMQRLETLQTKVDYFTEGQGHSVVAANALGPLPLSQTRSVQQAMQLEQHLNALEEQMAKTHRALNWIMQSLEANNLTCNLMPPELSSPKKQKAVEKREELQLSTIDPVLQYLKEKLQLIVVSRSPVYPNSFVHRYPVPDDKVAWDTNFGDYDPVVYTSDVILAGPPYADSIDLLTITAQEREGCIAFNKFDAESKVSRRSFEGDYKVIDGMPLNPHGRTGVQGRGLLGRWGPNFTGDPLVTRFKCNSQGQQLLEKGKPILEFIAIKRQDNKMWAIPGAFCLPDEKPWDILSKYFTMEALGSLMEDPRTKDEVESKLEILSEKGIMLYQGYADDARCTDNAWIETSVVNYHDDKGDILQHFDLRAGKGTLAASWLTVSSRIALHGSHLYFLKLAADRYAATF